MHTATLLALQDELEKIGGIGSAALDVGGLGMLAAPTVQKLRGKPMSDKGKDRLELAGLGTLGASVAAEHAHDAVAAGKAGLSKLKGLVSKMPKHAGLNDGVLEAKIMRAKFAPDEEPKKRKKTKHASTKEAVSKEWISKAVSGSKAGKARIQSFAQSNRHKAFSLASSGSEKSFQNADKRLHAAHEATKQAAPTMGAMMNMHRLADAAKAAKPVASAAAGAGKALTNPGNMGRAAHLAGHMAQGGHAWNPATAAKRAISL